MTPTTQRVAGLVLAGGRSSRMGQDKALLALDGETLLARNCRILQQAGCQQVFISGHSRDSHQPNEAIADNIADQGPVGGILSVMKQLQTHWHWLLIVAVDMPHLTPQSLAVMMAGLPGCSAGRYMAESHFPLLLRISQQHIHRIEQQLCGSSKRSRSLYRLLQDLELEPCDSQDQAQQYINVNTPQQWRDCLLHKQRVSGDN